ncbi:hypothetical protein NDN08_000271 [Rhodosorus marinus]|uniref:Protein kinase domain-containing protein n=1 Tax=Rhodosorus marinus TaxID=101924 RepID=A0AAV8UET6_9RHOD|nr:hypothetical protein NDN08_000271 [Rhodosorus marinus]
MADLAAGEGMGIAVRLIETTLERIDQVQCNKATAKWARGRVEAIRESLAKHQNLDKLSLERLNRALESLNTQVDGWRCKKQYLSRFVSADKFVKMFKCCMDQLDQCIRDLQLDIALDLSYGLEDALCEDFAELRSEIQKLQTSVGEAVERIVDETGDVKEMLGTILHELRHSQGREKPGKKPFWYLRFEDVALGDLIRLGAQGRVVKGTYRKSTLVAVKEIDLFSGAEAEYRTFCVEVEIMHRLRHPNIVFPIGAYFPLQEESRCPFLVMELVDGCDLSRAIHDKKHQRFIEGTARKVDVARQIAVGMSYMHQMHVIHRDLKPGNVLVPGDERAVKIADFGVAKIVQETAVIQGTAVTHAGANGGTYQYMAPECVPEDQPTFNRKTDVFSFGVLMWELFSGEVPYKGLHLRSIFRQLENGTYDFPSSAMKDDCPEEVKTLTCECLSKAPGERPEFGTIVVRLEETLWGLDPGREAPESPGEVEDRLSTVMSDEEDDKSSENKSRNGRGIGQTPQEGAVASTIGPEQPANAGKTVYRRGELGPGVGRGVPA